MSFPKMRQFKQLDLCLSLFGNNVFFDGVKVEVMHKGAKYFQIHRDNHKMAYKTAVTRNSTKQFTKRFAMNGGRWGRHFQYYLGRLCRQLKDPKNHDKPNMALKNYLMPIGRQQQPKVEITTTQGVKRRPSAIDQVFGHGFRSQLLQYINAGAYWTDQAIWWNDICCKGSNWKVQKVVTFRFHCRNSSFGMRLEGNNKCIMKTNNGYIFQFKNAYKFTYGNHEPILLAFGSFWAMVPSFRPNGWINDKFSSLNAINQNKRQNGWYFMTNLIEPVFLIHRCVRFENIQNTLPEKFKNQSAVGFYKKFSFNMHSLMLAKQTCESSEARKKIELPCGPVFKCKKHEKSRCFHCTTRFMVFPQSDWKQTWKCNITTNPWFNVLDFDNGLAMTLMKSVHSKCDYQY